MIVSNSCLINLVVVSQLNRVIIAQAARLAERHLPDGSRSGEAASFHGADVGAQRGQPVIVGHLLAGMLPTDVSNHGSDAVGGFGFEITAVPAGEYKLHIVHVVADDMVAPRLSSIHFATNRHPHYLLSHRFLMHRRLVSLKEVGRWNVV